MSEKYPAEPASFVLLNHTIPRIFRRNFEKELFDTGATNKSIFKTLKHMDNNLDKIFDRLYYIKEDLEALHKREQEALQKKEQEALQRKEEALRKKEEEALRKKEQEALLQQKQQELQDQQQSEKTNKADKSSAHDQKLKPVVEDHEKEKKNQDKEKKDQEQEQNWTQEQQSRLEKAIVAHKDIKDPKEKWTLIAKDVSGKTMEECVARFKYCKQQALDKKNKPEEEKKIEESKRPAEDAEESSEGEEGAHGPGDEGGSSEEESSSDDEAKPNVNHNDSVKVNCTLNYKLNILQLTTKNVALAHLIKVQVQVACKSCKSINTLTAERIPQTDYLVSNQQCTKCKSPSNIFFRIGYIHKQNNIAALFGSLYWDIRDVHFCDWAVTCEFCDTPNQSGLILSGTLIDRDCFGCYKKMLLSYMAMTISANVVDDGEADPDDYIGEDSLAKKQGGGTTKQLKVGKFKLDEQLPKKGSCKHAKNSFRYFRFPCCGKAYPCDSCHDTEEKHEMIMAKTMICGYCSMEQPVSDFCKRCTKMVTKTSKKTGYWEGGQGNRNKSTMNTKDRRKFAGTAKTESRKARESKAQGK